MLSPAVTTSIEHLTSVVISFAVIVVVGAFVAMLLARTFGGKSPAMRQAIFSISAFASLCAAAYYATSMLNGSG
jgi:tetrahydromethanopterin S-methyltransferase subunit C